VTTAERIATSIFLAAGIETIWEECAAPQCRPLVHQEAPDETPNILIVINADATPGTRRNALGISLPVVGEGNHAGIFYSRIAAAARETSVSLGASLAAILAHAMAHEIGHLLLRSTTHEKEGLMRGGWTFLEFHAMKSSTLLFSVSEAATMRRAITNWSRTRKKGGGIRTGSKGP
jgi:hypothetical protein